MLARGITKLHLDSRDLLSIITGVTPAKTGGYLVYESGECFRMGPGDFVIVPSSVIKHGNRYFVVVCCYLLVCLFGYSLGCTY